MKTHNIPFESFIPKGKVSFNMGNGELYMTTNMDIDSNYRVSDPIKHYAYINEKFKLPFRIDIKIKADAPTIYWILNKRLENGEDEYLSRGDIEIKRYGEYVDISLIYGLEKTWLAYCNKDRRQSDYIKSVKHKPIPEGFADNLYFAMACSKLIELKIAAVSVIEFENDESIILAKINESPDETDISLCPKVSKSSRLLEYIKNFPTDLQNEIIKTDEFLMKNVKNTLKFKRTIDSSRIVYMLKDIAVFRITIVGTRMWLNISWDFTSSGDYLMATIDKLADTLPEYADKIFSRVSDCWNCCNCGAKTFEYNGKRKLACLGLLGGLTFKMIPSEFEDIRKVIGALSEVVMSKGM